MNLLAWFLKRFGAVGTAIIGCLLAVILYLLFALAYQKVTGYFDGRSLEKTQARLQTTTVERDVARKNVENEQKSADAATEARESNNERVGNARRATAGAVKRASDAIESTPVAPTVRFAAELQDDAAAVARYRSAARRVRGTGPE